MGLLDRGRDAFGSWARGLFDYDSSSPLPPPATVREDDYLRRKTYKELQEEGWVAPSSEHGAGSYGSVSGYGDDLYEYEKPSDSWWDENKGKLAEGLAGIEDDTPQETKLTGLPSIDPAIATQRGYSPVPADLVSSQRTFGRSSTITAAQARKMANDQMLAYWAAQQAGLGLLSLIPNQRQITTQTLFSA